MKRITVLQKTSLRIILKKKPRERVSSSIKILSFIPNRFYPVPCAKVRCEVSPDHMTVIFLHDFNDRGIILIVADVTE